ncbi:Gfo/Idh/MocA family oxidoreductase [Candidatus Poribacteria bacterium]|nr:Gfo/Idh/MocA family oxidoreductase [Candidatus Poribacteria bacterium]
MPRVLRVIHVGAGGRGAWPLDVVARMDGYVSAALVDVNPSYLEAARQKTGLPASVCFSDVQDAVGSVEADLAIICTPTVTHVPYARIAFGAGVHVLTEKGMTLDWELARAAVDEAEQARLCFCVSQNYRYFQVERTMREAFGTEQYGEPSFLDLIHHRYRPEPRTLDYKNAMIWDMSCHHFDNFVYWFGPAQRVTARTFGAPWSRYTPHDANVSAVIEFANGVVATYCLTHVAQNDFHRTFIHTTTGTLRCHDIAGIEFRPTHSRDAQAVPLLSVPQSEQSVLEDVYRYILEGVEPGISGRNNLQTLALCEATGRASDERRTVEIGELFD